MIKEKFNREKVLNKTRKSQLQKHQEQLDFELKKFEEKMHFKFQLFYNELSKNQDGV